MDYDKDWCLCGRSGELTFLAISNVRYASGQQKDSIAFLYKNDTIPPLLAPLIRREGVPGKPKRQRDSMRKWKSISQSFSCNAQSLAVSAPMNHPPPLTRNGPNFCRNGTKSCHSHPASKPTPAKGPFPGPFLICTTRPKVVQISPKVVQICTTKTSPQA